MSLTVGHILANLAIVLARDQTFLEARHVKAEFVCVAQQACHVYALLRKIRSCISQNLPYLYQQRRAHAKPIP